MSRLRSVGKAVLVVAGLAAVVACQPDPTGGARPPAAGAAGVPAFTGSARAATRSDVALSWREGCPVHWSALRVLSVAHWGYDGARHVGVLVVHRDQAGAVLAVFQALYDDRFQVQRIRPVDEYGADDDRSMAANNTSAFNCRTIAGTTGMSEHSYGWAIDINPMQNPYVRDGRYDPPGSERWRNRSDVVPGMIVHDDKVVRAFRYIGWEWGGYWTSLKDYQHFSLTNR